MKQKLMTALLGLTLSIAAVSAFAADSGSLAFLQVGKDYLIVISTDTGPYGLNPKQETRITIVSKTADSWAEVRTWRSTFWLNFNHVIMVREAEAEPSTAQ